MRIFRITFLMMVGVLAIVSPSAAQTYENVSIVYDIEFDSDEVDEMSRSMLEGSTMTMMFLGDKVRLEMDMNVMTTIAISDESDETGIVLMDMFGQKMYQMIDAESMEDQPDEEFEIEYTGDTQEIAGFETKKVIVTYAGGRTAEMWIAEDIQPRSEDNEFTLKGVNGMPLQMDMEQDGMTMHLVAVEVSTEEPDASLFDTTPPPGYTEMDN